MSIDRISVHSRPAPTHRHKQTGTEYVLVGMGRMRAKNWFDAKALATKLMSDEPSSEELETIDLRKVVILRPSFGDHEVYPREEFEELFEEIG